MEDKPRSKIVPPDPERVIEGLRDTGYSIESAIEDLIDNSIDAKATLIDVKFDIDFEGEITVYILDNGYGMNSAGLEDAMKYGSKKRHDPSYLGKFGLGLKTASTAFCRKLSVISKDKNSEFVKATWDLDHVAKVGDWELLFPDPTKHELKYITDIIGDSAGTLVKWEKVDRVLKQYQDPGGKFAQMALQKTVNRVRDHAGMVYQMYLDERDERARNLKILINGDEVLPWNPFTHGTYELVAEERRPVQFSDGRTASFTIRAYILPRQDEFDSKTSREEARIKNEFQGIYAYRENRLIYGPDWMNIYIKEPHTTLLRVEFSFDHKLDDAFNIDIKKSQIILNEELRNWLEKFLTAPRRAAIERYRKGQKLKAEDASKKNA